MLGVVAYHEPAAIAKHDCVMSTSGRWFVIQHHHIPVLVENHRVVVIRHKEKLVSVPRDRLIDPKSGDPNVPLGIRLDRAHEPVCGERRNDWRAEPAASKFEHRSRGVFETGKQRWDVSRKRVHSDFPFRLPRCSIRLTAFCQVGDMSVPCITWLLAIFAFVIPSSRPQTSHSEHV